jgi:hypothetical protein
MAALFGMEHYEVITLSWLIAAAVWVGVSIFGFTLAYFVFRERRPAVARKPVTVPAPAVPTPARHEGVTPVGAA